MIDVFCGCDVPRVVRETDVGKAHPCEQCGRVVYLICAEQLPADAGAGDFDATLSVLQGPAHVGAIVQLGGVVDIEVGKDPGKHLMLNGPRVSRAHAKLMRVDFGPSKWKVVDTGSRNGVFVNGVRVTERELKDGDELLIGDFLMLFGHVAGASDDLYALPAVAAPEPARTSAASTAFGTARTIDRARYDAAIGGGDPCPSCERALPKNAKICIDCGINATTGRPILTKQGVDEDSLHESARNWIWWISFFVWVTPFPIPIRSEAFGAKKPYAIWTIALATILASITFFATERAADDGGPATKFAGTNLMLWAPTDSTTPQHAVSPEKIHQIAKKLTPDERQELTQEYAKPNERLTDDQLIERVIDSVKDDILASRGEFHWYQLVTHAFLHDTSSIYNFAMHLGGNLVFMLCFGTRVNALIGNIATALLYPLLAIMAATVHIVALGNEPSGPMVGASGAIMGLAGMYLILFPAHRVFCAMWISIWLRFRRIFGLKIFSLRGFWVLLIYFGYDIAMNIINSHFGIHEGVAHWAHIGGFSTGALIGLGILFSRLFNTHGGDVLSVTLGRHAWPLIGKPNRWSDAPVLTPAVG